MSNQHNTQSSIASILREFGELSGEIPPDKDLLTELGIKSINFINILLALEEKFGLTIDDTEFTQARTLDSLTLLIDNSRSRLSTK